MDFLELVREARSCRRFVESQPLTQADIDWLLECARLAPSAKNAQELRFISVSHGPVCDQLFSFTRWAGALKDWNGPVAGERPTAFIAVLMPERGGDLLCYDVGICCQTMQLAATSRGWGACMLQSFDRKGATDLLKPPAGLKIALLVGFGVALEKRMVDALGADGSTAYWRDAQGTHHVPKRALTELLVNRF